MLIYLPKNKSLNTSLSRTLFYTQRATYASTSSSPFRLSSSPKQPQSQSQPQATEDEEAYRYEYEAENEGAYYSPYKPKRQWPPDMSKLSPKHQLRLERKYRRRAALKYARPRWVKFTKLAQWGIIICECLSSLWDFLSFLTDAGTVIVIYSLLFIEWGKEGEEHPFEDVSDLPDWKYLSNTDNENSSERISSLRLTRYFRLLSDLSRRKNKRISEQNSKDCQIILSWQNV